MRQHTYMHRDKHTQAHKDTYTVSGFYHSAWRLICFLYKLLMMHSCPTSTELSRPHTCTAAHIRHVGMMMNSPSLKLSVHLATRGLQPYEHCVSIFQDLCFPVGHIQLPYHVLTIKTLCLLAAKTSDLLPENSQQAEAHYLVCCDFPKLFQFTLFLS